MGKHFKEPDKKHKDRRLRALLIAAALAAVVLFGFFYLSKESHVPEPPTAAVQSQDISSDIQNAPQEIFNGALSEDIMKNKIKELAASKDSKALSDEPDRNDNGFKIAAGGPVVYKLKRPILAIIIDDGGNSIEFTKRAAQLGIPVTWSIIPSQRYTHEALSAARSAKIPFLVHMPMQALVDKDSSAYLIGVDTPPEEIKRRCTAALDSMDGAIGMNNHRGSKATSDKKTMREVMKAIKERGLTFVDSNTYEKSVAYQTAIEAGIPTLKNNAFLDHEQSEKAIAAAFQKAVRLAQRRGAAVAICHFRPATIDFLEELDKNYKTLPVTLVTVPEMLLELMTAEKAR